MEIPLDNTEEFPSLGSNTNITVVNNKHDLWSNRKQFTEVVKNTEIKFDYDILNKMINETDIEYFNRLVSHIKKTSVIYNYKIFLCKKKSTSYRVCARHEIVARVLCQLEENKYELRENSKEYRNFKNNTIDRMRDDENFWYSIMDIVDGDESQIDKAIKAFYKKSVQDSDTNITWLDVDKVTCIETNDLYFSKEKII